MLNRFRMRKEKPSKSESISGTSDTNAAIIQDAATTEHRKLILDAGRWEARVTVDEESVSQNLTQWIINIDGVEGTLYEGEHFQLLFKFNNKYPFDSPEVTFIGSNIPVHPHVYSNGHICLSILTDDWSPALSVQSVCLSISSMLSSCREKRRPPDNGIYVKTCNKNPKKTKWWYHDDSV
ncbi:hypothetical protein pipiens_004970 [Culex pipiens pipiens]|uniref:N-terminal E2 ubiquitin-conjugating enzyme n=1 Tax=Culex pipiens pipiens TaxID=38569 RepID=A0ABD1CCT5_CULPP